MNSSERLLAARSFKVGDPWCTDQGHWVPNPVEKALYYIKPPGRGGTPSGGGSPFQRQERYFFEPRSSPGTVNAGEPGNFSQVTITPHSEESVGYANGTAGLSALSDRTSVGRFARGAESARSG
jgi:hypothetical protein